MSSLSLIYSLFWWNMHFQRDTSFFTPCISKAMFTWMIVQLKCIENNIQCSFESIVFGNWCHSCSSFFVFRLFCSFWQFNDYLFCFEIFTVICSPVVLFSFIMVGIRQTFVIGIFLFGRSFFLYSLETVNVIFSVLFLETPADLTLYFLHQLLWLYDIFFFSFIFCLFSLIF